MKKSLFIISVLLICSSVNAQTGHIDELFDKYSEKEGFTSVYISGKMLNMFADLDSESVDPDSIVFRISSIRILSQDSLSTEKVNFYTELSKKLDFSVYEELMVVKEGQEVTKFLVRQKGSTINELLVISGGLHSNSLISIRGDLNLKSLSGLSDKMGIQELDDLEKIERDKQKK